MARQNSISEKLVENCVRDFPTEFLGEPLDFLHQQLRMDGFAPDLVFKTTAGEIVIVEIQLGRLDRYHLYKCIEYRDLYAERHANSQIRLVLIAEELEPRYSTLIQTHKIDLRIFPRALLQQMLDRLAPETDETKSRIEQSSSTGRLSVRKLLQQLSRESWETADLPPGSDRCVVTAIWPHVLSESEKRRGLALRLPSSPQDQLRDDHELLPVLWLIDQACFENLDRSGFQLLDAWMCVFGTFDQHPEFVLSDAIQYHNAFGYDYREYLSGRLRDGYAHLAKRYGLDKGWDIELIARDLRLFSELSLFRFQHGLPHRDRLFRNFEILTGVGSLESVWLDRMANKAGPYAPFQLHELSPEALEAIKLDSCSVRLRDLDHHLWYGLSSVLRLTSEFDLANRNPAAHHMFASRPVRLSRLDPHVFELARKYLPVGHRGR